MAKRLVLAHVRSTAVALATVLAVGARPDVASAVVYTNVTTSAGINHVQHPGSAGRRFPQDRRRCRGRLR